MFIDAHELQANSPVECDICIIGGGAAGITIAREFLSSKFQVAVIIGGGKSPEAEAQILSDGESVDNRYFPPIAAAVRCLGGNTTHWGSWCRRFDPLDFEKRSWVPHSGWPINAEDLEPFYKEAHEILKLGGTTFDPARATAELGDPKFSPLSLATSELETKVWRFHKPPVCFGRDHEAELATSQNVKLYLNGHATTLALEQNGGALREVTMKTISGKVTSVKARYYILAAGGIQNPRLLLASRDVQKAGVGNDRDLVGRYFMDHPHLHHNGLIALSNLENYPTLYDTNSQYKQFIVGGLCPSETYQRSQNILNCAVNFKPSHRSVAGSGATESVGDKVMALWDDVTMLPGKVYRRARKAVGLKNQTAPERLYLDVITRSEQSPNPDSRIVLSERSDSLGVPLVKIDWQVTGFERRTMLDVHKQVARAFGASSLGRMKIEILPQEISDSGFWEATKEEGRFEGGWHQMGATRMSDDPSSGVVDGNCKVFGIDNLYIAGSSVFTTSSAFNPTMTIVALALRLSQHLQEKKLTV